MSLISTKFRSDMTSALLSLIWNMQFCKEQTRTRCHYWYLHARVPPMAVPVPGWINKRMSQWYWVFKWVAQKSLGSLTLPMLAWSPVPCMLYFHRISFSCSSSRDSEMMTRLKPVPCFLDMSGWTSSPIFFRRGPIFSRHQSWNVWWWFWKLR